MVVPEFEESFDFESGLGGWAGHADGLPEGSFWAVDAENGDAAEGQGAAWLSMSVLEAQGRVWMARAFDVSPGQSYQVTLTWALGTDDDASTTAWDILAAGGATAPTASSLAAHGTTAPEVPGGTVWEERSITFQATSGAAVGGGETGTLWIGLGIAPTSPDDRQYGVDEIRVSFLRTH